MRNSGALIARAHEDQEILVSSFHEEICEGLLTSLTFPVEQSGHVTANLEIHTTGFHDDVARSGEKRLHGTA